MRTRFVPLLLEHAAARGLDVGALAQRLGVPPEARSLARWSIEGAPAVPIAALDALAEAVALALGDPSLGITLADSVPRGGYDVVEFAARHAPTLRAALERLVRYQRLINDAVVCAIEDAEDVVAWTHRVPGAPEGVGRHGNLFTVRSMIRLARELIPGVAIREVVLAHAARAELGERLGAARVRFGAGYNAVVFAAADAAREVVGADPALLPVLETAAASRLPADDPSAGWVERVRAELRRALPGGAVAIGDVAGALRTSPRNLQRQLGAAGTSFSAVLDALRHEEAARLLSSPNVPLLEVAFLLGYSDARAFLRAFKRWSGESPQRYRRRALG